jgi:predicted transglutaminase-like cysteine proteinase
MTQSTPVKWLVSIVAVSLLLSAADGRSRSAHDTTAPASLVETSPSLTPFQHVRFCLHYPADCRSDPTEEERIDLTGENSELLNRVNRSVNAAIVPVQKSYGDSLHEGWRIAPFMGDCNDYAVTKRHELLASGLPAKALRLAVVKTRSGDGHLVLLVATTKGELVLDNLTEVIVPWQSADYRWLKIQSARDARFWLDVEVSGASQPYPDRKLPLPDRQSASGREMLSRGSRIVRAPASDPLSSVNADASRTR